MKSITPTFSYFLGLITGRGHLFHDSKIIAIEFSHANEYAEGIAHCPVCGWLATNNGNGLKCKNPACGKPVDPSVKKTYNQPVSTVESLKNVIIPFLSKEIGANFDITGNKTMTLLVVDFQDYEKVFDEVLSHFVPDMSFDRFHIPKAIYEVEKASKIEFINGLLDTSGFPSPGGWLNRDGEKGHGRMRVYFQLVRNWHLPVEIDNFLRSEFGLPIHTIDWGHPNIRDANLTDFFNARPTTWSREHQLKFFPEYYGMFKFRISSKQSLFDELHNHNVATVFKDKDDWFPPSKVTTGKIKAYHPGEQDLRIPEPARKHFNAFWQINLAMGCKFLGELQKHSKNPEYFALTGDSKGDGDIDVLMRERDAISAKLKEEAFAKGAEPTEKKLRKEQDAESVLESSLYEPLSDYLHEYLTKKYEEDVITFDTSAGNLNLFLKNRNPSLLEVFDYCDQYRIRPDIVGFLTKTRRIAFIEAKITPLDLKAIGQLLGYCFVAQPEEALLVSNKPIATSLVMILKARPDLLEYSEGKRIKLGVWTGKSLESIEI